MRWLILLMGVLANASASVLVKVAVDGLGAAPVGDRPWRLLQSPPLVAGVLLYGAAFMLYALALTRLPLNVAHPILTSGAVALVALSSFAFFRETFYWTTWLGILFVAIGVWLIAQRG